MVSSSQAQLSGMWLEHLDHSERYTINTFSVCYGTDTNTYFQLTRNGKSISKGNFSISCQCYNDCLLCRSLATKIEQSHRNATYTEKEGSKVCKYNIKMAKYC
jgi:hypothetical protein